MNKRKTSRQKKPKALAPWGHVFRFEPVRTMLFVGLPGVVLFGYMSARLEYAHLIWICLGVFWLSAFGFSVYGARRILTPADEDAQKRMLMDWVSSSESKAEREYRRSIVSSESTASAFAIAGLASDGPDMNIDGTPMLGDTGVDVMGKAYGDIGGLGGWGQSSLGDDTGSSFDSSSSSGSSSSFGDSSSGF